MPERFELNLTDYMRNILLLAFFSILTNLMLAQGVTTGTIDGVITDSNNKSLPGATVLALHVPSGSQYGTATRPDGRYTIPNVRVGGPYTITVSFIGYQENKISEIYVSLGRAFNHNV